MTRFHVFAFVGLVLVGSAGVRAQDRRAPAAPSAPVAPAAPPAPAAPAAPPSPVAQGDNAAQQPRQVGPANLLSVKVRIVLSKYQGEKKISSLPYEIAIHADGRLGNIRLNTRVAVPSEGAASTAPTNYRDVGTNIDCRVRSLDSGRFAVDVTIDDSSVYRDEPSGVTGMPTFRSFRAVDALVLRDGQTSEFTAATDKVSGEVIKAEITLSVVK